MAQYSISVKSGYLDVEVYELYRVVARFPPAPEALVLGPGARVFREVDVQPVARLLRQVAFVSGEGARFLRLERGYARHLDAQAVHAFRALGGQELAVRGVAFLEVFCRLVFAVLEPAGDEPDDVLVVRVRHGHHLSEDLRRSPVVQVLLANADLLHCVGFLVELVDRAVHCPVGALPDELGFLEGLLELAVFERGLLFHCRLQGVQL